jgi:hypothetical protein
LFASHVLWTLLLALTAPLRLQFDFLRGGLAALRNLGPIRRRRAEEKRLTRRTDRDVLSLFKELQRRPHTL